MQKKKNIFHKMMQKNTDEIKGKIISKQFDGFKSTFSETPPQDSSRVIKNCGKDLPGGWNTYYNSGNICKKNKSIVSCEVGCGSSVSDNPTVENSLYCSPYPFTVKTWDGLGKGECNQNSWTDYYCGTNKLNKGTQEIWFSPESKNLDNYWVFHACDGAGLQVDCMGDLYYIEQFGPREDENKNYCKDYKGLQLGEGFTCDSTGFNTSNNILNDKATKCQHQSCTFKHPRTQNNYQWYRSGWWGLNYYSWDRPDPNGINKFYSRGDNIKNNNAEAWMDYYPPLQVANLCKDGQTANCDNISGNDWNNYWWPAWASISPWTCHLDSMYKSGLTDFSGPNRYGSDKNMVLNCYSDNEPWSGRCIDNPYYNNNSNLIYQGGLNNQCNNMPKNMSFYLFKKLTDDIMQVYEVDMQKLKIQDIYSKNIDWSWDNTNIKFKLKRHREGQKNLTDYGYDFKPW